AARDTRRLRLLREVPAEVDLGPHDPVVAVEGQHLGVAPTTPVGTAELVGDDHLVASPNQADEVERLALCRAGPAALEPAVAVQLRVGRTGEAEVLAQPLFEERAIARGIGEIALAGNAKTIVRRHSRMTAASPRG